MVPRKTSRVVGIVVLAGVLSWFGYAYYIKTTTPQLEVLHNRVPYDVSVAASTFTPSVGETVKITFTVTLNGKPIDLAAQKIYPHPSVVSNDLGDVWFYHVDELPSSSPGVYEIEHTFARAADYTVWFEINNNQSVDHHGQSSDFVGRIAFDVQGAPTNPKVVPAYATTKAQNFSADEDYTLRMLPSALVAGTPATFTVVAETSDGARVPLLPNFDHFYIIVSPQADSFYHLDHPQPTTKGETQVVAGPLTFPQAGKYALWIRLFPDDGSGKVTDAIEGTLVFEVK